MNEEHDLKESVAKLGRLVPIIKDAHGNIIDGFHRQQLDPKWADEFSIKLENITDPVQLQLARMNINLCRRTVSPEEKIQWLKQLAELTQWTPKQISENSGMSYTWVMKYLPKEFKDKEMVELATRRVAEPEPEELASAHAVSEVKMPEIQKEARIETCAYCGIGTWLGKEWQGQTVCPIHYERLERGEITLEKPTVTPAKVEPKIIKPKDTWEQRKATMQVPVSKMDEAVFLALQDNETLRQAGWKFEFQKHYCIKEVISDITATRGDIEKPLFIDGKVHEGREDRDTANRELLAKRGVEVLSLSYEAYSDAERDRITKQIIETLKT